MSVTQPEFDRLKNKVSKLETNASIAYTLTVGDTITAGQLSSSARDSSQQNFYGYSRFIDNKNDNYSGISLVNYKDSSLTNNFSYIDFRNNLNTPDSAIYAGHNTDGSSYIRIHTTPAGVRNTDRRNAGNLEIYDGYVRSITAFTASNGIYSAQNMILASGKGIDFAANASAAGMTSELLNDYEHGTFTPALSAGTTAPTVTYALQAGKYTKIGNMVYFSIRMDVSARTGGSGTTYITGLPFTCNGTTNEHACFIGYFNNLTYNSAAVMNAYVADGTTRIEFVENTSGGSGTYSAWAVTNWVTSVGNTSAIIISGFYRTNS